MKEERLAISDVGFGNGNNGLADAEAKTAAAEGRIKANDEKLEAVNVGNVENEATRNTLGDKLAQGEKQIQDSEGKLGQQEARLGAVLPKPKPTAPKTDEPPSTGFGKVPLIPQLPQIPKEGCGFDNKRDECEDEEGEGFGGPLETVNDISDPPSCSSCECGCNLTGHCRSCGDGDDDDDDDDDEGDGD